MQAKLDQVDTLLRQLDGESLAPTQDVLWGPKPTGSQFSGQIINFINCFLEDGCDLEDKGSGLVIGCNDDLRGQAYDGSIPVNPPLVEPPSCRPWQHVDTHADPHDSNSQSMPQMTINTRKHSRSTPVVADCDSGLRSCSLPSSSAPSHSTTPWQTLMRRGQLFPSATSSSDNVGSPSAAYAPVQKQVMAFSQVARHQ